MRAGARTSGLPVRSEASLGLGTWALGGTGWGPASDRAERLAAIRRALDLGVRHIDTAPAYGEAESLVGEAVEGRRDEVVLATKVGPRDAPGDSVRRSLRRLRTDRVDVLFLHECLEGWERRLEAMASLREHGMALHLGVSNATPGQIARALEIAPVEAYQGQYNPVDRDVEEAHLPLLRERGIAFWAYRPLASGLLGGARHRDPFEQGDHRSRIYWFRGRELERRRKVVAALEKLARKRQVSVAHVALGWTLARPGVGVVLAGARSAAQAEANAGAVVLDEEDVAAVDAAVAEAFRPPRATPEALGADWGERERFIVERLDGGRTYESIASEWSSAADRPMIAAQVKVFADGLVERGLARDG